MAAATSIAMAGVGVLGSGYQMIKGAKDARDAKNALDNYQRQELRNVAQDLQVSTLGSDLQREEQARLAASQVGALQGSGVRGVIGGLGRVEAGNQMTTRQTAAELDAQQKQIDQMYAQDQSNIRNMQESRENQDIAGLSSQYNAGQQTFNQGLSGMAQTAMSGLGALNRSQDIKGVKTNSANNFTSTNIDSSPLFDLQNNRSIAQPNMSTAQPNQVPTTIGGALQGLNNQFYNTSSLGNYQGQIPSNLNSFMQSQVYSPQNNLFQQSN